MSNIRCIAVLVLFSAASFSNVIIAEPGESFTLVSADGAEMTLPTDQRGVGIYLFWASWCPYCQALMPHIQSVVDEYGDAVTVYALNFRDEEDPSEYIGHRGFSFVNLPDADAVAAAWGVRGTPAVFVIDRAGSLCFDQYELSVTNPPGWDSMSHVQKARRRAPYWAARLRESIDRILEQGH